MCIRDRCRGLSFQTQHSLKKNCLKYTDTACTRNHPIIANCAVYISSFSLTLGIFRINNNKRYWIWLSCDEELSCSPCPVIANCMFSMLTADCIFAWLIRFTLQWHYVPVNSKTVHLPRAIPRHLTNVKLQTGGNLNLNQARPVGHLTFVSKRVSAVGNKRISQFHVGFSVVVVTLYRGICISRLLPQRWH